MKISKNMSIGEFAALVALILQSKGISTVLTGGAVVSIYTENKYMSYDADFISPADQKTISKAMQELDFQRHGKEFRYKQTDFFPDSLQDFWRLVISLYIRLSYTSVSRI